MEDILNNEKVVVTDREKKDVVWFLEKNPDVIPYVKSILAMLCDYFGAKCIDYKVEISFAPDLDDEEHMLLVEVVLALEKEARKLHQNGVRLKVIGDLSRFEPHLVDLVRNSETLTENNSKLTLTIAANYGGRWDIMQAMQAMLKARPELANGFEEGDLQPHLSMPYAPEPDLFIRTGGEQRISNFMLWQLAYTELWFTETLWPDLDDTVLDAAMAAFADRERRFGLTSAQVAGGAT